VIQRTHRDFSLIVPTLNEAGNVGRLIPRLQQVLGAIHDGSLSYEIIICDDASEDGTAEIAASLPDSWQGSIRVLRRTSSFGLGEAILDGFAVATGRVLGVIDADFQHDESILPQMLSKACTYDIVIGSRYDFLGKIAGWSKVREAESRFAASLTRRTLGLQVCDPLSGYFMLSRSLYEGIKHQLKPQGWKILLEVLGNAPMAKFAEVPFTFRPRTEGETKMTWRVAKDWLAQLQRLRALRAARSVAAEPIQRLPVAIPGKVGAR
jgi:dolichol-phosphate mannosyltransferase